MISINRSNAISLFFEKDYKNFLNSIFFVLLLLFTTATKLRFIESPPLGFFDVLVLLYCFIAYWSGNLDIKSGFSTIIYPALFFILLIVSYALNSSSELSYVLAMGIEAKQHLFYHDMMAYFYCFVISYIFLNSYLRKIDLVIYILLVLFFSLILIFVKSIGNFSFFYPSAEIQFRFSFLSANPNQFAIAVLPFPFLFYYLIKKAHNRYIYFLLFFTVSFFIGIKVKSYSLLLSWVLCLPLCLLLENFKKNQYNKYILFVFFPMLFIIGVYIFFQYSNSFCNEASVRIELWKTVVQEIWNNGVILGSGPGSLTKFHTEPLYAKFGYVSHLESHNTYLEIAKQSGIIPLCIFSFFSIKYALYALRQKEWELFFILMSILAFSFAHSCLRMPILYIYLVIFYKLLYNYKIQTEA